MPGERAPAFSVEQENNKKIVAAKQNNRLALKPDISLPHSVLDGQWQMTLGEGSDTTELTLQLKQNDQVVTGKLDTFPITGFVKGNTFSTTVRTRGDGGKVRFRYRGVIDPAGDVMAGTVVIEVEEASDSPSSFRSLVSAAVACSAC